MADKQRVTPGGHAKVKTIHAVQSWAHPLGPLLLIIGGCLVQIELIVKNNVEPILRKKIDNKQESIQCGVLWKIAIANSRNSAG